MSTFDFDQDLQKITDWFNDRIEDNQDLQSIGSWFESTIDEAEEFTGLPVVAPGLTDEEMQIERNVSICKPFRVDKEEKEEVTYDPLDDPFFLRRKTL